MQNTKISSFQFLVLVIFFSIGTSILVVPSALAMHSKQDAWLAAIVGTLIGVLIIWFYTTISLWFPSLTYVQLNEKILGKWIGKFTSFLFICMALLFAASLITYSAYFLNTEMLPTTPRPIISILNCGVIVFALRLGLETFSKAAEIFIFIFFVLFILLAFFLLPELDIKNLEPFFQASAVDIGKSSLQLITVSAMNAIVLLMIFPAFVKDHDKSKKLFLVGNIIGGLVMIIITALCIFVLGSNATTKQIYPSYALAKEINVGGFVNRVEAAMAGLWILGLFFKSIIYFYAAIVGLSQIFQLKNYQSMVFPLGMIVCALSLTLYPSLLYQQEFDRTTGVSLSIVVCLFIPILLTIVYFIRKKQLKKAASSDKQTN